MDISEHQYKAGGISENDYLMIKLQLLQFESDVEQAQLAKVQALSDLRQLLGYESVSADYDVVGSFEYQPVKVNLEDLQAEGVAESPGPARGAARRDRGEQPVGIAKGEWQAGCDRSGQLLARQRHQRRYVSM